MLQSLFKQSSIYFIGLIAGKALTTLTWIMIARMLTPPLTGQFILYMTLLELTTLFSDFGLIQWYLKQVEYHDKIELFQKIINARIFTLLVSIVCLGLFLFMTNTFSINISLILLISLIPIALHSVSDAYFLHQKKSHIIALKSIVYNLTFLVGIYIFRDMLSLSNMVVICLVGLLFTTVFFFPWHMVINFKFASFKHSIKILGSSSVYALLILTSYAYSRGDSLVINYLAGSSALAIYALAYRFLESLSLFPTAINRILFPISAKTSGVSEQQLIKITLTMTVIGIITALCLFISADVLIAILGPQYSNALPILRIFSLVSFLFFINAPIATVVQSSKYVKNFLPYGIANTVGNLLLNLMIVPIYGIQGAAWVMAITETTGFLINLFFVRKLYQSN